MEKLTGILTVITASLLTAIIIALGICIRALPIMVAILFAYALII